VDEAAGASFITSLPSLLERGEVKESKVSKEFKRERNRETGIT